jgi:hypothetical protein
MSDVDVAMGLLTLVPFCSRKNSWLFMVGGFNPSEKYESQLG